MTSSKIINRLVAVVYSSLQIQEQHCLHTRNRFNVWYTRYLDAVLCFLYRATFSLFSMSLLMLTLLTADRFSRQASFASNPFALCKLQYILKQMNNKALKQLISLHLPTVNVTAMVVTGQGRLQTYFPVQVLALARQPDNSRAQMWRLPTGAGSDATRREGATM